MTTIEQSGAGVSSCPNCRTALPAQAVICVSCGYSLRDGKLLTTVVESPSGERPTAAVRDDGNPYRAPSPHDTYAVSEPRRSGLPESRESNFRIESLEHRIRELERRIDGTWLVAPGFFTRVWAVFGHMMMANLIIFIIYFFVGMCVVMLLTLLG